MSTSENVLFLLRAKAQELSDMVDGLGPSHAVSMAKAKIGEAMLWATEHIKPQEPGSGPPPPDGG